MLSRYALTDTGLDLARKIEQQETQGVLPGMDKVTEGSSRIGFTIGSEYWWCFFFHQWEQLSQYFKRCIRLYLQIKTEAEFLFCILQHWVILRLAVTMKKPWNRTRVR